MNTYCVCMMDNDSHKEEYFEVLGKNAQDAVDYIRSFDTKGRAVINVYIETAEEWT